MAEYYIEHNGNHTIFWLWKFTKLESGHTRGENIYASNGCQTDAKPMWKSPEQYSEEMEDDMNTMEKTTRENAFLLMI